MRGTGRRALSLMLAGVCAAALVAGVGATPPTLTVIPHVPGASGTLSRGVSDDGAVVVGFAVMPDLRFRAFRWTVAGHQFFEPLSRATDWAAYCVSGDGSVAAGYSDTAGGPHRACRWTPAGPTNLGTLPGGTNSIAWGISRDGATIVGASDTRAFCWSASSGMQDLGAPQGSDGASARDVSDDGGVIVGTHNPGGGIERAFRWTTLGIHDLGVLAGGGDAVANAVSGDGAVMVGYSDSSSGRRAVRWTTGGPQSLGVLPGHTSSSASDVNHDGSLIVGSSSIDSLGHAAFWHDSLGIVELQPYLVSLGVNFDGVALTGITRVSGDGTAMIGAGRFGFVVYSWVLTGLPPLAPRCPGNIATGGASATAVDIDDLLMVISAWGPCPAPPTPCPANIVTSGASATVVNIDDLLAVISAWGPCP